MSLVSLAGSTSNKALREALSQPLESRITDTWKPELQAEIKRIQKLYYVLFIEMETWQIDIEPLDKNYRGMAVLDDAAEDIIKSNTALSTRPTDFGLLFVDQLDRADIAGQLRPCVVLAGLYLEYVALSRPRPAERSVKEEYWDRVYSSVVTAHLRYKDEPF